MNRLIVRLAALSLLSACAHMATPETSTASTPAAASAPAAPAPTAEARMLASQADALLMSGKSAESLPLYRQAWEQGVRTEGMSYNAACAAALAGEKAEALTWLERAVDAGFARGRAPEEGRGPRLPARGARLRPHRREGGGQRGEAHGGPESGAA